MPLINANTPWASRNPFASLLPSVEQIRKAVPVTPQLIPDNLNMESIPDVTPPSDALNDNLLSFVKEQEGFSPKAFGDYQQYSIGYGTKAKSANETITQAEADARLSDELSQSQQRIQQAAQANGLQLTPNQLNALTSFDFNTGKGAYLLSTSKDLDEVKNRMGQYVKAGGKTLQGLVDRRKAELALFDS